MADNVQVCERCGRSGAQRIEGYLLCDDCYQAAGSCCNESLEPGETVTDEPGDPPHDPQQYPAR